MRQRLVRAVGMRLRALSVAALLAVASVGLHTVSATAGPAPSAHVLGRAQVIELVQRRFDGRVLACRYLARRGLYQVKLLRGDGVMRLIFVDATSGAIVAVR